MQLAIVIMAAGKGTRLKSRRPKVLHQVGGRPLVEHVIAAAAQVVEPKDIYVVIGHEAEAVRAALAHTGVRFVVQAEQRGTGHAIQTARPEVEGYENLIVLSGDAPMITHGDDPEAAGLPSGAAGGDDDPDGAAAEIRRDMDA